MAAEAKLNPIENNRTELEAENKLLRQRLVKLESLVSSMENFERDRHPDPVFKDIIDEIQKVIEKYGIRA